jgi:hypothetical protein
MRPPVKKFITRTPASRLRNQANRRSEALRLPAPDDNARRVARIAGAAECRMRKFRRRAENVFQARGPHAEIDLFAEPLPLGACGVPTPQTTAPVAGRRSAARDAFLRGIPYLRRCRICICRFFAARLPRPAIHPGADGARAARRHHL